MKILKHHNIMGCLYALLLAMPFIAIGVRCAYVALNKNAYQSAEITQTTYQATPKYTQGDINNGLEVGKIYHLEATELQSNAIFNSYDQGNEIDFNILNGEFYITNNIGYTLEDLYQGTIDKPNIQFYDYDYMYIEFNVANMLADVFIEESSISINADILINYIQVQNISLDIDLQYFSNTNYQDYNYTQFESTTLDNVFEYSVNTFIQDNNFGKVDFFQWTTDLFFDSNQVNNMYVHYVNWYFNYALLMSMTYILFLVLMWFVNFARRLLERGMNYDF